MSSGRALLPVQTGIARIIGSIDTDERPVRLYNTLTRRKEELAPLGAGGVKIYSCGPTVYRYVHVGNLRTFMFADLLCRIARVPRPPTTQVMNITDVGHLTDDTFDRGEDKMLVSARLENKSPEEIAAYYTEAFMDDAARVNIRPAAHYPRATALHPADDRDHRQADRQGARLRGRRNGLLRHRELSRLRQALAQHDATSC